MNEICMDLINMGIGFMGVGEYEKAKEKFSEAVNSDKTSYDAYYHLGNAHINLNELEEGIESFRKALMIKEDGETFYTIACAYFLNDDYLNAVKYYNRAEEAGYKNVEMYEIMADIFSKSGDLLQALRSIDKAILVSPFNGSLWSQKAILQIEIGEYEGALETIDEFLKLLPDAFDAYQLKVNVLCLLDRNEEAIDLAYNAFEKFPEDGMIALILIKALIEANKINEANELIINVKANGICEGLEKELTLQEAIIYAQNDDPGKLITCLEQALVSKPDDEELLNMLLNTYVAIGDLKKINTIANRIIDTCKSNIVLATAKFYKALVCKKSGQLEFAKESFLTLSKELRKATIKDPSQQELYMYRLLCDIELENFEKALEMTDYLESLYPEAVDTHAFRYLIYKKMGEDEKAKMEKELARNVKPNFIGVEGD